MHQILPLSKYLPIGRNIDFERWFTAPLTNAESPTLTVCNKGDCPRRVMGGPTSASYQNNYLLWNLWSVAETGGEMKEFLNKHPAFTPTYVRKLRDNFDWFVTKSL